MPSAVSARRSVDAEWPAHPFRKSRYLKAVRGQLNLPLFFETMAVLGRDLCLERIGKALRGLYSFTHTHIHLAGSQNDNP